MCDGTREHTPELPYPDQVDVLSLARGFYTERTLEEIMRRYNSQPDLLAACERLCRCASWRDDVSDLERSALDEAAEAIARARKE